MKDLPRALFEGYIAFKYGHHRTERARYRELAREGQKPGVMLIACCDSRAAPETIFDAIPGPSFVVRHLANLVPPYDPDGGHYSIPATLEFGANVLKVQHIVVLGHARCGGVMAAMERDTQAPLAPDDAIGHWISLIDPAKARLEAMDPPPEDGAEALEKLSVIQSIENLKSFPFIARRVDDGSLQLHGAYFDIETGVLSWFDKASGWFKPLDDVVKMPGVIASEDTP